MFILLTDDENDNEGSTLHSAFIQSIPKWFSVTMCLYAEYYWITQTGGNPIQVSSQLGWNDRWFCLSDLADIYILTIGLSAYQSLHIVYAYSS